MSNESVFVKTSIATRDLRRHRLRDAAYFSHPTGEFAQPEGGVRLD